jgi:hypothetical protein
MKSWRATWLEIAKAYSTPRKERTQRQQQIARDGICIAYAIVRESRVGNLVFRLTGEWNPYLYPLTPSDDIKRATIACFLAAMGEKTYLELTNDN